MKKCELCKSVAVMYCDSDQAYLCWDCDSKVHSANFLVTKHTRTLLCHVCQSLTPWTGSGSKLARTISLCNSCVNTREDRVLGNGNNTEDNDDDDDGGDDDDDDVDDDDDGENQVVPLSLPQSLASSSSGEESSSSRREGSSISRFGLFKFYNKN